LRFFAALILMSLVAAPAIATCPQSSYDIAGYALGSDLAAWADTYTYSDGYGDGGTSMIEFGVPQATLTATVSAYGYGQSTADLSLVDDFVVVGLPPGTPVQFEVRLKLDGETGEAPPYSTWGVSGMLRDAHGHVAQTPAGSFHGTLALAQSEDAGVPFRLVFEVRAECFGEGGTGMSGSFSFAGLPAGAAVTSCKGFVSDPSVPARAMSWGRLKTRYR
jgi:hypothetical protein